MNVWTVANQKGGVGKTTTAVTLASLLAAQGADTLLVDLDPHASASAYLLGAERRHPGAGATALFEAVAGNAPCDVAAFCEQTRQARLSILRGTPGLAAIERRLGQCEGAGQVLSRALGRGANAFAHVIVDCPPTLGLLMINALAAAGHVIVPVQTEPLALEGLRRMLATLEMVGRAQGRVVPRTIVATLHDPRTRAARNTLQALRQEHARRLWPGIIPVDTRLRDASQCGEPAPVFSPWARAVLAYEDLLAHLQRDAARDTPLLLEEVL